MSPIARVTLAERIMTVLTVIVLGAFTAWFIYNQKRIPPLSKESVQFTALAVNVFAGILTTFSFALVGILIWAKRILKI